MGFLTEIKRSGYKPTRVVLFGSYAYGRPDELSDIDLAIWDEKFTGCGTIDIEPIASLKSRFSKLELHTFNANENPADNPFAEEILRKGELIPQTQPV